jgi:hypothetical protein
LNRRAAPIRSRPDRSVRFCSQPNLQLDGGGADAEPGRQLGERVSFAQVGQDQQSLPAGVELAPG